MFILKSPYFISQADILMVVCIWVACTVVIADFSERGLDDTCIQKCDNIFNECFAACKNAFAINDPRFDSCAYNCDNTVAPCFVNCPRN